MKTSLLAAFSFATFTASPALLLALAALFLHDPRRPSALDDFLVAAYLVALSSALSTIGFLIPTAASALWRHLAPSRAVIIAGALGLIAPIASLVVAALGAPAVLPLFHSAPWLAIALMHGLPGVILGIAATLLARAFRGTTAAHTLQGFW